METDLLMSYRGSFGPVIIFKSVHLRCFPESHLNQLIICQKYVFLNVK